MRAEIQRRKYSPKTERVYLYWVRQYIYFHKKQHPRYLSSDGVSAFLSHLVSARKVSGATQRQALNAIIFLYKQVLGIDMGDLNYLRNMKVFKNIPTVLSADEVRQVLSSMSGTPKLMACLLYGSGLRVNECVTLGVQDVDTAHKTLTVRNTKGYKARVVMIPDILITPLNKHLVWRKQLHSADLRNGAGHVHLPDALAKKYKSAAASFPWQYLFPSKRVNRHLSSEPGMRWHTSITTLQKAMRRAVKQCGLNKRVTCHTLRHSFATQLLNAGYDIRSIQQLMGHKDLNTTMIYTHVLLQGTESVTSPLDTL